MKRLLVLLLVTGVVAGALAWQAKQRWEQPLAVGAEGYHLTVAAGQSLRGLAGELQAQGVYDFPWLLRLYGRSADG